MDRKREPLPASVVFVDVETTGLGMADRIVTLGAVRLATAGLADGRPDVECLHLAFDPRRDCHPLAAAVHGYDDWSLRHQDLFADHAESVRTFIHAAELVVAHNAAFDIRFLDHELAQAARPPIGLGQFCTMTQYGWRGHAGSAKLDTVCRKIGVARSSARHGALEDAWLAMQVYLWLQGHPVTRQMPAEVRSPPTNWQTPPPRPEGVLPKRTKKAARSRP